MPDEGAGGDRTEAATPRRLQRAREEGQVALTREATPLAVLATGALLLGIAAPAAGRALLARLAAFLTLPPDTPPAQALHAALSATLLLGLPFLLACALAGTVAVLAQTGGLVHLERLLPDLSRLDPARGIGRMFSATSLADLAKSLVKLIATGVAAWIVLGDAVPMLADSLAWTPAMLLDRAAREVLRLTLTLIGAQAAITAFDLLRARLSFASSMRMSRQELRDEMKETEGDPQIKARIRRLRMQRARRRMLKAVPKAAVVVTNPTHYAVALAYQRGSTAAPRVVAKGVDEVATRIREVARAHNVPIVANPPLARTLFALELDSEIPRELYQTVAEVIAYVWRLRSRRL